MLSHVEIEETLEAKEFHIRVHMMRLIDSEHLDENDILILAREFEECADVMHDLTTYHALSQNIYDLVAFIRQNTSLIAQKHSLFLQFMNSFTPTLQQLRVVLFDLDIENKNGFYASFANDCKMIESFVTGEFKSGIDGADCLF